MVEIAQDGRLLADGTPLVEPDVAKMIPRLGKVASQEIAKATRDALVPITERRVEMTGLDRRVRFDLPLRSFEHLKAVSEILDTLSRGLEGLSYMRHKQEAEVLREARNLVDRAKRRMANV